MRSLNILKKSCGAAISGSITFPLSTMRITPAILITCPITDIISYSFCGPEYVKWIGLNCVDHFMDYCSQVRWIICEPLSAKIDNPLSRCSRVRLFPYDYPIRL
jgi:hypothetical protein